MGEPRLLERDEELRVVAAFVHAGRVLVIEGAPGLGKTALLDEGCEQARRMGHVVLRALGSDLETDFGFGVVRQLFERWLGELPEQERRQLEEGPVAVALPVVSGVVDPAFGEASFAVLHGLYWLAAAAAEQKPLLIAVDDAQWADEPSLRWLAYLARRIEGLPIRLLLATRHGGPTVQSASVVALRRSAAVLSPVPLSEAAVNELTQQAGVGADGLGSSIWSATAGNPFFVHELLRAVAARELEPASPTAGFPIGGHAVTRQVLGRFEGLDPHALKLAGALSVLADGTPLHFAAAAAGLSGAEAAAAAATLADAGVLEGQGRPRFVHPIVREAMASSLPAEVQDKMHRKIAGLLVEEAAPAGLVAAHLLRVHPAADNWVVERLREAATAASDAGAPEIAARLLERALIEPPAAADRVAVLRQAASADERAGLASASEKLELALRAASGPRERGEVSLELARTYDTAFRWVDAVDVLEAAIVEIGDVDADLTAELEGRLVVYAVRDGRTAPRMPRVVARMAQRELKGGAAEAFAVAQAQAASYAGATAEQVAVPLEALLRRGEDTATDWATRPGLLMILLVAERYDSVAAALEVMAREVARTGDTRALVITNAVLCQLTFRVGALPEAESSVRTALEAVQNSNFRAALSMLAPVLADVLVEADDLPAAEAALAPVMEVDAPPSIGGVLVPAAVGRLRLAQGRPQEALAAFESCGHLMSAAVWGIDIHDHGYVHWRSGASRALLQMGDRDRAASLAESELADVTAVGAGRARGVALRALGLARGGAQGRTLLDESVSALRTTPAALELAHSLAALGAALRREGQRSAARKPLREALEIARSCGAVRLLHAVADELSASGLAVTTTRHGTDALTPSELRIARLAAAGASNKQIAQELYLTVKTIEMHLSSVYRKLDISARTQLAAALPG